MKTISLQGAYDLHIHAAPDCFDRIGNDIEIARQARDAGMKAIALKSVYEKTESRAWHTMQSVDGITVYGGVTMDYHVGGVNPLAVEPCLKMGGRIVWLPTYHAAGHARGFGRVGGFGYAGKEAEAKPLLGLRILDEAGAISEPVREIVSLCGQYRAILGTGHITTEETVALMQYCRREGFTRLVVNHPLFLVPKMQLSEIAELLEMGAYMEFCSTEICPIPGGGNLGDYAALISRCGSRRMLLASDGGHNRMGWPAEALRVFAQQIAYSGVPLSDVQAMMRQNYAELLGE